MMARQVIKDLVYGAIDLCTARRGVNRMIGGESVRFPVRWCRWYATDYEPGTFAFLRAHCGRGDTVIDLGAHLGVFTVVMARLVGPNGHVFSFEPTPQTRRVLEETVRLNGCDTIVEVHGEAVAGATGTAVFYDTGDIVSNANSLVHTGRSREGLEVPTIRLDDFVAQQDLRCLPQDRCRRRRTRASARRPPDVLDLPSSRSTLAAPGPDPGGRRLLGRDLGTPAGVSLVRELAERQSDRESGRVKIPRQGLVRAAGRPI